MRMKSADDGTTTVSATGATAAAPPKSRKFEKVYQSFKSELLHSAPGTPIASVRELMRRYQVSQITVTRALKQLQEDGLVESKVGYGSFRSGNNGSDCRNIAFFHSDYPSSFGHLVNRTFEKYFTERNYHFKMISYDHRHVHVERSMLNGGADAVIFNQDQNLSPELLVQLTSWSIPIVFIDIMPQTIALDAVCADNEMGGAMVANYFIRHGHRRCAMLQSLPEGHSPVSRRRSFLRQLKLSQTESVFINCETQGGENSTANAYRTFTTYIKEHGLDFTALFCDSDLGSLGVLKACHNLGIRVPEDLSIIGFDNIPECGYFQPSLSSMDQDVPRWAEETEKILLARLNGDRRAVFQTYIEPKLILRDSVRGKTDGKEEAKRDTL